MVAPVRALASVSVDLDSLSHYFRIHAMPALLDEETGVRLIYEKALPRFEAVFQEAHVTGTYFAIGQDLQFSVAKNAIKNAHLHGMEIASHSHSHDYTLSRWPKEAILNDLRMAHAAISDATQVAPTGFRAPGYTLSPGLLQAVQDMGYFYDSSAFPAVPYYLAKAAIMGLLACLGRPSSAILDSPRVLTAPTGPYRALPERPYQRAESGIWELPVTTLPYTRFPFIGTFALTLPLSWVRFGYNRLRHVPHLNFELHGLDLLDANDGIPSALVARQRELRVPHQAKMKRLRQLLSWFQADFDVQPLTKAVDAFMNARVD